MTRSPSPGERHRSSAASSSDSRDRRRGRRAPPQDSEIKSSVLEVRLLNVSSQGLAVESREALRIGARYEFQLVGGRGRSKPISGLVLWCRLHRTEKGANDDVHAIFQAGIQRLRQDDEG